MITAGNFIERRANDAGTIGFKLEEYGLGFTAGGLAFGSPEPGLMLMATGGAFSIFGGGAQFVGGAFQMMGGSYNVGITNMEASSLTLIIGVGFGKTVAPRFIGPLSTSQRSAVNAARNTAIGGGAFMDGLWSTLDKLQPQEAPVP